MSWSDGKTITESDTGGQVGANYRNLPSFLLSQSAKPAKCAGQATAESRADP
jgi:hypothetical protein